MSALGQRNGYIRNRGVTETISMTVQSGKYKIHVRCSMFQDNKINQIRFVSESKGSALVAGFGFRRCWGFGGNANSKGDRNALDCRSQTSWSCLSILGEPTLPSTSVS